MQRYLVYYPKLFYFRNLSYIFLLPPQILVFSWGFFVTEGAVTLVAFCFLWRKSFHVFFFIFERLPKLFLYFICYFFLLFPKLRYHKNFFRLIFCCFLFLLHDLKNSCYSSEPLRTGKHTFLSSNFTEASEQRRVSKQLQKQAKKCSIDI